jgi:hypothetical protein
MSVKHLCTSRPAGREIDQTSMPSVENNYQETAISLDKDKRTYIRYYKRQWGYNTLI